MGLFNLFKKKDDDDNQSNKPQDQMLTLNERQKPTLKSDSKPPSQSTIPPQMQPQSEGVMLTPDPEVNNGNKTVYSFDEAPAPEPESYARENLATKSLEKNIKSMPSVKKLVIPSNDQAMAEQVKATDSVVAERVKLKQVELPGGEKQESIAADTSNFVPGEFIDIQLSFFIENMDGKYLTPNATTLFDNSSTVRFTKDEILSIMAQGAFAVVGSALLARFPAGVVSEAGKSTSEVLEFPMDKVLSMVPPTWFMIQGQDESLNASLNNMANPFQDLEAPSTPPKSIPEQKTGGLFDTQAEISVDVDEEENEKEVDPLETMVQTSVPEVEEEIDPEATIVQEKPPVAAAPQTETPPETNENQLVISASTIESALRPDIFFSFPKDANIKIPKSRVLASLAEGVFKFTAKEIDQFAGTSAVDGSRESELIEIDLGLVMGLIPPEWFSIENQDNSQNEILTNMRDVFDDSTFAEAAAEMEQEGESPEVEEADEPQEEEEVEVSAEVEEEEEASSLITGGAFGKMSSLFEDDDDEEEIEIEEEVEEEATKAKSSTSTFEEESAAQPQEETRAKSSTSTFEDDEEEIEIEEEIEEEASIEEDDSQSDALEVEPAAPVETEKPALTLQPPKVSADRPAIQLTPPPKSDSPAAQLTPPKPVAEPLAPEPEKEDTAENLDALQTITVHRDAAKTFDAERAAREQQAIISSQNEVVEEKVETPEPQIQESASLGDTNADPKAGEITYRPIADEVPDVSEKTILRPSTAPNGIDINRSNLRDLTRLHSAGEKLAQTLIEYREKNGDFKSINDLINVPGVGTSVYRSLTGLRPSSDLVAAERRLNKVVGFDEDKDYPLGKIINQAKEEFGFKSIILSDKDGFEICSSGDKSLLESNSELLAATTPQLFKKTRHFLKQSNLPHPEIFTFYLEDTPVTFGIADEVFMVMVHTGKWPEPKHMKKCKTLINELAWFCSYRAIV